MNCPHCGQRVLTRYGVLLSPREADLFDLIEAAGTRGIDIDVLGWTWAGAHKHVVTQRALIKTTISHINGKLDLGSSIYRIRGEGKHPVVYFLSRQTPL